MSIDIDTTKAFRRPSDLRDLVEAVVAALPEDEANWVEWKSRLPLDVAEGWYAIARQILGLANRHPDKAARFADGTGYLIVGAEAGLAPAGVDPVDVAQLDDWLRPYLGSSGPVWNATYLNLDGATVLVITVEAPRWGDPIWLLRKTHGVKGGASAGAIFARREAKTERADDADVDMLQERLQRGVVEPPLELLLEWASQPVHLRRIGSSEEERRAWLDGERDLLLDQLTNRRDDNTSSLSFLAQNFTNFYDQDKRTEAEFRSQVDRYIAACDDALYVETVAYCIEQGFNEVRLAVTNPTDRNLPDVEIQLYLPGPVEAYEAVEADWPRLPRRPRAFGKAVPVNFANAYSSRVLPSSYSVAHIVSNLSIENGGSAKLTFAVGNVRPRATVALDEFHVITGLDAGSVIHGRWTATSTSLSGVHEGVFDIEAAGEILTLGEAIEAARP